SPTKVGTIDDVVDARGAIPGSPGVPFHVRVEREELTLWVEGQVIGVAEAHGDELEGLAIGAGPADPAPGRVGPERTIGRAEAMLESICSERGRDGRRLRGPRQVTAVATDDVEGGSPRAQDDSMRSVLAGLVEAAQLLDPIEPVIAIGIAETV